MVSVVVKAKREKSEVWCTVEAAHHCYAGATLTADEHHLKMLTRVPLQKVIGCSPPNTRPHRPIIPPSPLPPCPTPIILFFYLFLFFSIILFNFKNFIKINLFTVGRFSERDKWTRFQNLPNQLPLSSFSIKALGVRWV